MKEISVQELQSWKKNNKIFQLIDIRDSYEFEWSNIEGKSIPLATVLGNLNQINTSGDVILHCNTGSRAEALIDILEQKHSFTNLINLKGGIVAWAEEIDSSKTVY